MSGLTISEAMKEISSGGGVQLLVPSLGKRLLFRRMTTGTQMTMGRIALSNPDHYRSGIVRLALFDELLLEGTKEYRSSHLKMVDVVAFHAQLRLQVQHGGANPKISMACPRCGRQETVEIDFKRILENCDRHEFRRELVKAEGGTPPRSYEFRLSEPSFLDVVILTEGMRRDSGARSSLVDLEVCYAYNKLCLYIDSVAIDGNEVEGDSGEKFSAIPVPDRMKFFDSLDQSLTLDPENPKSLVGVISKTFDEEALRHELFRGAVLPEKCGGKDCDVSLEEVMSYDAFFTA